jgi:hypothetical protein
MKMQVLTIFESLLINTGFTREELTHRSRIKDISLRNARQVMVTMLLKVLPIEEVRDITHLDEETILNLASEALNEDIAKIYFVAWDNYMLMMHNQISTYKQTHAYA